MKFIVFRKWCPEDREKVMARGQEWVKELQQYPEKYIRPMRLQDGSAIAFSMIGKYQGFSLVEADTEDQLQNTVSFWKPLMKFTFVPIRQGAVAKQI